MRGSTFPSYALMFGSLNPSGNGNSRISLLKGERLAAATNLSSYSSIAMIERRRSSNEIFFILWELAFIRILLAVESCEHYCSLLYSRSLISAPLPNLLNTFPKVLLPGLLLPVCTTSECSLFLWDSSIWERATPALGSTPVRWDLTTIRFTLVYREVVIRCPLPHSSLC